jgi:hypothetical protein
MVDRLLAVDEVTGLRKRLTQAQAQVAVGGDANAIHVNVDGEISAIALEVPSADDRFVFERGGASFAKKSARLNDMLGATQSGSISGAENADLSLYRNFRFVLSADVTLTFTNLVGGQRGIIQVIQNPVLLRTITFANAVFSGGVAPVITQTFNAVDLFEYYCDAFSVFVTVLGQDYQ